VDSHKGILSSEGSCLRKRCPRSERPLRSRWQASVTAATDCLATWYGLAVCEASHTRHPPHAPPTCGRARNKTRNKSQELKGQVKEATGRATGDPCLEAEGRADQTKANLKQAAEKSGTPSGPAMSGRAVDCPAVKVERSTDGLP